MRKDITIPEVKNVYIAAIKEWDEDFLQQNWFVYLINNSKEKLEMTIVISRGSNSEDWKTATLRHGFGVVEPNSFKKIEFLTEEVLSFKNEFLLTYFIEGTLYDKTFVFEAHSINEQYLQPVPLFENEGVLAN